MSTTAKTDQPLELVVPEEPSARPAVVSPRVLAVEPPLKEELTFADALVIIADGRWLIALTAAVMLVIGIVYVFLATPVYSADALVQVEKKSSKAGQLSEFFAESSPTEAEIEILRSRALVGSVVDELKLDLEVAPRHFPIVGRTIAARRSGRGPASALLGLSRYAWGGERVEVQHLEVPPELEGQELTLVAGKEGRFTIETPERELLLTGEVGRTLRSGPAERAGVAVFVAELVARPGTEFRLVKTSHSAAVEDLRRALSITEVGKMTGVIRLELESTNKRRTSATLDAVTRAYLRQNVERRSAEAEKTLELLETQLPILKANVDAAESALNAHRSRNGSVDLRLETQRRLERSVEVERSLSELDVQRVDMRRKYTDRHPELIALEHKIAQLQTERDAIQAKMEELPRAELQAARLTRDVKVSSELYMLLLNKAQELRIVKSGTIGNVRIVDAAVLPDRPVSPKKAATAIGALLLGVGLGVVFAFARKAPDRGVQDPDVIEPRLGIGAYASVPRSVTQAELERLARRTNAKGPPILAVTDASDVAVESLRALGTALEFALVGRRVIMLTGPSPGVGTSFVTLNLAAVLAERGKRVLVVDANMRKGRLHRQLGLAQSPGLSEVIGGGTSIDDAVRETIVKNVWFLPTGCSPPSPSELFASERFRAVAGELSRRYDLVLVDTAPILAVTDAMLIGRAADVTLLVLRAGRHPMREIALAVTRLAQSGVRPGGFVFNGVPLRSGVLGSSDGTPCQYEYR